MRKKLLALLMCATMVLGTAATAMAATPSADDYTNATKVLKGWDTVSKEYDVSKKPVTFTTVYTDDVPTVVTYTWAFDDASGTIVKVDPSSTKNKWAKATNDGQVLAAISDDYNYIVTNSSVTTGNVVKSGNSLYYVSDVDDRTLEVGSTKLELKDGEYLLTWNSAGASGAALQGTYIYDYAYGSVLVDGTTANTTLGLKANGNIATGATSSATVDASGKVTYTTSTTALPISYKVVTLTEFTAAETGTIATGSSIDAYGIDVDGYIALQDGEVGFTADASSAKPYYAVFGKADTTKLADVAQALADGTITKDAVAVSINFYEAVQASQNSKTANADGDTYRSNGRQDGFMTLIPVSAKLSDTTVTFKTDWLSRTSVKNANAVYLLDQNVTSLSSYFKQIDTVWKISDLEDESFSSKYLVSGTYIFDYNEDASQNDGVSDTDTTATTTASTTAATSPKTGDVAPIAALAVVMMGACGAMVVASKKRA
jgi:hypothetical protein